MSWARAINQMLVYTPVYICLPAVQMGRKFAETRESRMPCGSVLRGVVGNPLHRIIKINLRDCVE